MKVRDAMATTVKTATPQDTVASVAKLMKNEDAGFIPVVQDERLIGVVTDRDIVVRCVAEQHEGLLNEAVEHVMSTGVQSVSPDDDIEIVGKRMQDEQVRRLAVVEGDRLVGVITHGNLVQATGGEGPAKDATTGVTRGA